MISSYDRDSCKTEHHRSGHSLRNRRTSAGIAGVDAGTQRAIENAIFHSEKPASEGILIGFDRLPTGNNLN
jgi:hypothetical protein